MSESAVVRHTSVANKWKTVHLLLHPGHNATQIQYNVTFQREDDTDFTMSFNVAVDTREVPQANVSRAESKDADKEPKPTATPEPALQFLDVPQDKQGPKIHKKQPAELQVVIEVPSLNMSLLPAFVQSELQQLEEKFLIGDITLKGYNLTKAELLKPHMTLAQKQQVSQSHAANEGAAKVQGKPYKDLEGEHLGAKPPVEEKAGSIIHRNQNSKEELSRKGVAVREKTVTPLVPVHIDDEHKRDFETPEHFNLNAAIERPINSKLLSSISKTKSVQSLPERADTAGGAAVGRRLQHFISSDRGFLPWERRKYFQELLEVRNAYRFSLHTFLISLNINIFLRCLCRKRSFCRENCHTSLMAPPPAEGCRTLLRTRCATSTSCSTASLDSRPAKSPRTCRT